MEGKTGNRDGKLVIGVGLTGGRKSKDILKWAMERFVPEDNVTFKLLYVYPKITAVPSPLGGWLPVAQVQEDLVTRFRQEIEWTKKKLLLPYQKILKANKIKSDTIVLESDDIAMAISLEATRLAIRHLVIGVSSSAWGISWKKLAIKTGGTNLSASISETAPDSCSVYVVAAGKLEHLRPANSEPKLITRDDTSRLSRTSYASSNSSLFTDSSISTSKPRELDGFQKDMAASKRSAKEYLKLKHNLPGMDLSFSASSVTSQSSISGYSESTFSAYSGGSFVGNSPQDRSYVSSFVGTPTTAASSQYWSAAGSNSVGSSVVQTPDIEELRTKLRNMEKMYEMAQKGVINEALDDMSKRLVEESVKLREEVPTAEHLFSTKTSVSNISHEKLETRAPQEMEDSYRKLKQQLERQGSQFQKFALEEIVQATSNFSDEFKIGAGTLGTVYKCKLHHTAVAVKILNTQDGVTNRQLLQELEILSKVRHPHLLLLLGAIPGEGLLVYEYMENGSLEDRLFRKDNTLPLPWYERLRICWEVAGALAFLHSTKPTPIIHRDLKPANILLDKNMVSKIGDVSLGIMINEELTNDSHKTLYKETSLAGTLCYIDPEYQRTGRVSTKSDIYALGVLILQLLTAKSAVGIAYVVEEAIDEGKLMEIVDQEAGKWPENEALDLALLGLQCAELRGRDRPCLTEKVLHTLERLKGVADTAREQASRASVVVPPHFICPLRKDVMEDPYVLADGYTYDRIAIEQWLEENDTSPTTNLPLPHTFIMPNLTMLEAIKQWKSKQLPK